jgi:hypothetical protein
MIAQNPGDLVSTKSESEDGASFGAAPAFEAPPAGGAVAAVDVGSAGAITDPRSFPSAGGIEVFLLRSLRRIASPAGL